MQTTKLLIGFVPYGQSTAKYLPDFLTSLERAVFGLPGIKIMAVDNTENSDNDNQKFIRANYPDMQVLSFGRNLGFAKANNALIAQAIAAGADFYLALNPDMIVAPDAIKIMLEKIKSDGKLGSVGPKVLQWESAVRAPSPASLPAQAGRQPTIDTCGIVLQAGLHFLDLGQCEVDSHQYDRAAILGPSGCAALYRLSALVKVKDEHGYFDERMFMYKEDCDLAYRLFLAGWQSCLAPKAIIYHDRSASALGDSNLSAALNRKNKSKAIRKWSFANQQLIVKKYWAKQSGGNKLAIVWRQMLIFGYAAVFERELIKSTKYQDPMTK